MIEGERRDELILAALSRTRGIVRAAPIADKDRRSILEVEEDAEARSLMGLGKVINAGVREVLECDWCYVALTDLEFSWGNGANLIMKKGDEVVGEEVENKEKIERLSKDPNVWFLHRNFVVYKDKISFPRDVMEKICYFEIPSHPADWFVLEEADFRYQFIVYGYPSTPCDVFLKERYFQGRDERGSGTILVGVKL